jgi:ribosomal-protein-alanine N-acetyltransferase
MAAAGARAPLFPRARHDPGAATGARFSGWVLRRLEASDLAALAALHAHCFPADRWDARAIAELLAMAGASGHLVQQAGQASPLGFILDLILAGNAEVLTLAVAPPTRRRGIARALIDDLILRAWRGGARAIALEVAADNSAARQLYEGCGFSQDGRRRGYYRRTGGTMDALIFRRTLLG